MRSRAPRSKWTCSMMQVSASAKVVGVFQLRSFSRGAFRDTSGRGRGQRNESGLAKAYDLPVRVELGAVIPGARWRRLREVATFPGRIGLTLIGCPEPGEQAEEDIQGAPTRRMHDHRALLPGAHLSSR